MDTITRIDSAPGQPDPLTNFDYYPGNTCSNHQAVVAKTLVLDPESTGLDHHETEYCYTNEGEVKKVIDARDHTATMKYDSNSNV